MVKTELASVMASVSVVLKPLHKNMLHRSLDVDYCITSQYHVATFLSS